MNTANEIVYEEKIEKLRDALAQADAVVVGAGAGLSTAAGLTYSGERFARYFPDFIARYGLRDMYSAGFFPYPTPEEMWAYWSRHIWCNRYIPTPKDTYDKLLQLVRDKDYFAITTNVDHRFQVAGFDKQRLFYTQGDYGLWQCSAPCHDATYDNEQVARAMIESQGFTITADGSLIEPKDTSDLKMYVPSELVPKCPRCGEPMAMNLRADDTFVEDDGWNEAAARYRAFIEAHESGRVVYLELGVGGNTPVIIKYPFWRYVNSNPEATYACVNLGEAFAHSAILERSILIDEGIDRVLNDLLG